MYKSQNHSGPGLTIIALEFREIEYCVCHVLVQQSKSLCTGCSIVDKHYSRSSAVYADVVEQLYKKVKVSNIKTSFLSSSSFHKLECLEVLCNIMYAFIEQFPFNNPTQIEFSSISCMINFSMRAITGDECTQFKNFQQRYTKILYYTNYILY